MTTFNILGSSTTAQTLVSGEDGLIGPNGTLAVMTGAAVTMNGPADVAVLGAIIAMGGDAILGAPGLAEINVGAGGEIISLGGDAIDLDLTTTCTIFNAGNISSSASDGLRLLAADAGATVVLSNSGHIAGVVAGVSASLGNGSISIINSGTIEGTVGFNALDLLAADITINNSGTIVGTIWSSSTTGATTIRNTGTILGSIHLDGAGQIDTRGGFVTGTLTGGEGSNTFRIDRADIDILDDGTTGSDTVYSSVTYATGNGIERLVLTGSADIRGYGSAAADMLEGNRGDNRLGGGDGDDSMIGWAGNDTLLGGLGNDLLFLDPGDDLLAGGAGIDTLSLGVLAQGANVNLTTGSAVGTDCDTDTLGGFENVVGGAGKDTITGSAAANVLMGGALADVLNGAAGADSLQGDAGADQLTGGSGADRFIFLALGDSTAAAADVITDFAVATEKIDLSAIDPDPGAINAFAFGGAAFLAQGTASVRVVQDVPNNRTIVEIRDATGPEVDMTIYLTGLMSLAAANFLL